MDYQEQLCCLINCRHIWINGTFTIVPHPFKQLKLLIGVDKQIKKYIALACIVLQNFCLIMIFFIITPLLQLLSYFN